MKIPFFVLILTILTVSAEGQSKNTLVFGNALEKYKNMQKIGTGMTIIGGAALFTGNLLYWKVYNDGKAEHSENKAKTYGKVMFGGIGLMAVGIPVWAIGKTKERHIIIEANLVKFKGLASANGVGLKICF
jgi:hypothetical protein